MNIPTTNVRYRQIASELSEPGDIRSLHLSNGKTTIELFYLATLCDEAKIQSSVILPFIDGTDGKAWASRFTSLPGVRDVTGQSGAARMLLYGHALIYWGPFVFAFDANLVLNDKPLQSSIETSIQGPQSSLSENNGTNLNLIRHQYASPSLHVEYHQVGRVSGAELIKSCFSGRPPNLDEVRTPAFTNVLCGLFVVCSFAYLSLSHENYYFKEAERWLMVRLAFELFLCAGAVFLLRRKAGA